jgi:4-diphosphocytidyl-2-C-methyl-D-erythritol kinase
MSVGEHGIRRTPDSPRSGWAGAAPAKVNLFLRVLAREEGGYHQIETLFQSLELADQVKLELRGAGEGIELEVEGIAPGSLGPSASNLVVRAAEAFLARLSGDASPAGRTGVRIGLRKRIPHGAGLGGGSSDAATTLRGLNEMLGFPLSGSELLEIGETLGADVAFFLCAAPLALAWGRGDRVLPIAPLPAAGVLLALPPWGIATPDAYASLARSRAASGATSAGARAYGRGLAPGTSPGMSPWTSWEGVAAEAENAFEGPVFADHPELVRIQGALEVAGARIARLSGSGSAVFGVFPGSKAPTRQQVDTVIEAAGVEGLRVLATRTRGTERADAPG